ncbi:hypothetical protein METBIDRAFT_10344 [Metschnikowia bicuspidata var. bicuspidata NRRL YB-4993]|uniref:Cyclin N-terminal domain-containing protein n=1 Tax=Metschnikowia bicuspidata var. bicuspidata NRRL YB-4993 TaxID=869754 RepID=A0A1A0HJJ2_9ASCO|nr:hypothetical protein METBIDRAFT_10344 [Metschnikowia bicuspidata var. bicuspidata NRRL YB-4993]OBA24180.1 hypothetical protein METBIDRAFT_10344 [Metschnikowia bicuspidata var. bicuspidata NRRL YB-4993]
MSAFSQTFVTCCFLILQTKKSDGSGGKQLARVVDSLDLSPSNLAVALIYLSKYQANSVNSLDNSESDSLHHYMVIASLILANKFINDQSYTLKTWHSIIHKCSDLRPSLALLNQLEQNFLASLDFALNTKHDPRLWMLFHSLNGKHVTQLRLAVDSSSSAPFRNGAKRGTSALYNYGLATPPLAFPINTSPLSYISSMTPSPREPYTPVALPTGLAGIAPMATQSFQLYPLPLLQQTPQRMALGGDEWSQPAKRRKLGHGMCGMGSALAPACTSHFSV